MENLKKIKNIVFDLGGVLFELDPMATVKSFGKYGVKDVEKTYREVIATEWFRDFEIGNISNEDFRKKMNDYCNTNMNPEEFAECWNAMIVSYPSENERLLENLKKDFNLYILSNTNRIHVEFFEPMSNWRNGLFVKRYYSNDIHCRKPDLEAFNYVITDAGINPCETLFIDDRADNIEGAKLAGLNTIHLKKQSDLYEHFSQYAK